MRKTVNIADMVTWANHILANSLSDKQVRHGVCSILETVLFNTGTYAGFRYLTEKDVPKGEKPGIVLGPDGYYTPLKDHEPVSNVFPDETRRAYYVHHRIGGTR